MCVCVCSLRSLRVVYSKLKEGKSEKENKLMGKEKGENVYAYRDSFPLKGTALMLFDTPVFQFGIQVIRKADNAVLATLNADSEQDRYKFVMDLQESIFEMDLMERALREANLIK